tara:strand:+ start:360 stop:524 length:165 start_codon:yes stop_codon:yes gene_type:complete
MVREGLQPTVSQLFQQSELGRSQVISGHDIEFDIQMATSVTLTFESLSVTPLGG